MWGLPWLEACYWIFLPTPRSRAFPRMYSPMQKKMGKCPFLTLWAHFRSGNQQSQQSWLSKHASGRPSGNPFLHVYSDKLFTGGRPCGSSTRDPFWPFWAAGDRKRVAIDHDGFVFFLCRGWFFSCRGMILLWRGLVLFFKARFDPRLCWIMNLWSTIVEVWDVS